MHIVRPLLIGFFSFLCISAVALLVYVGTLQLTVLNRSTVKVWLEEGGVYRNNLFPSLVHSGATPSTSSTNRYAIPDEVLKLALERTFTKDYVRVQTETIIDDFYNWLEGASPDFTLSIPIHQKRDTFIAEFSRAAAPHIAALPTCSIVQSSSTACRPANIAPELYAQTLITNSLDQSSFFRSAVTLPPVSSNNSPMFQVLKVVRAFQPYSLLVIVGLLLLAVSAAAAHIWLIPANQRLRGLAHIGKRIFFSQVFTFIGSLILLWGFASDFFKLPNITGGRPGIATETINAVIKLAVVDVAGMLALISGTLCVLGLAAWISILVYRRKKTRVSVAPIELPEDDIANPKTNG